jgi:uncharacterized protein
MGRAAEGSLSRRGPTGTSIGSVGASMIASSSTSSSGGSIPSHTSRKAPVPMRGSASSTRPAIVSPSSQPIRSISNGFIRTVWGGNGQWRLWSALALVIASKLRASALLTGPQSRRTGAILRVVTSDNREWVRRAYDSFNRRDWDRLDDLLAPDIEFQTMVESAQGAQAVAEWIRQADELMTDFRIEVEDVIEAGDRVVVLVQETARAKGSGLDMDMRVAHVWTLRDGRAVALRGYADQAEALEAVGAT